MCPILFLIDQTYHRGTLGLCGLANQQIDVMNPTHGRPLYKILDIWLHTCIISLLCPVLLPFGFPLFLISYHVWLLTCSNWWLLVRVLLSLTSFRSVLELLQPWGQLYLILGKGSRYCFSNSWLPMESPVISDFFLMYLNYWYHGVNGCLKVSTSRTCLLVPIGWWGLWFLGRKP